MTRPRLDLMTNHQHGCSHYPSARMLLEVHPDRDELYDLVDAPMAYVVAWHNTERTGWFVALWPVPDPHGETRLQ